MGTIGKSKRSKRRGTGWVVWIGGTKSRVYSSNITYNNTTTMDMKSSMYIFGKSLYYHWKGDTNSSYWLIHKKGKEKRNNERYFRTYNQLDKLEKKLISLATGDILDVGCATGYYIPSLMKKGSVIGIDISEYAIKVAEEKYGLNNCFVADIFKYKTNKKFDTITSLENNLGMSGSPEGTRKLLQIYWDLLKSNGQVLVIQRDIDKDYVIIDLTSKYKDQSAKFRWVHYSMDYLKKMCKKIGFQFELIDKNKTGNVMYLARLKKS